MVIRFQRRFNNVHRRALILSSVIVLYCLSVPVIAQVEKDDPLTIDSSIVLLNAVVTDSDGRAISGLKVSDFQLEESGVTQTIDFVEAQSAPFAVVILLDVSGSMRERVSLARSAAINFLWGIRERDSVAIYSFDSTVNLMQDFSNSRDLRSRVFDLKAKGYTALNDAVFKAADLLSGRKEKRRAIVVLSDGEDTRSRVSASKALKAAQDANATIYTVDMSEIAGGRRGKRQNRAVLKRFARRTGGVFLKTPGGVKLRNAFAEIVNELGILYTIGYYPINENYDGKWREISLTSIDGYAVRTREGYFAKKSN